MVQRRRPSGFIEPCLPSKVIRPPTGPLWVHEIKHDGYRLMVRRDGERVRCFTRGGHDWADRFPAIVEAACQILAPSFLIDGDNGNRPRRWHAGLPRAAEQAPGP
jgi:bifunctional non-homologous end joining protein LigD